MLYTLVFTFSLRYYFWGWHVYNVLLRNVSKLPRWCSTVFRKVLKHGPIVTCIPCAPCLWSGSEDSKACDLSDSQPAKQNSTCLHLTWMRLCDCSPDASVWWCAFSCPDLKCSSSVCDNTLKASLSVLPCRWAHVFLYIHRHIFVPWPTVTSGAPNCIVTGGNTSTCHLPFSMQFFLQAFYC